MKYFGNFRLLTIKKKNPCYTYTNCELEIICYPYPSFNVLFEYSKATVCNKPLM